MALRTTSQLRAIWGPDCATPSELSRINFNGVWVTVNTRCVQAFNALAFVMAWHHYFPSGNDTGAYNCRAITGGTGLSLHSFGIALDINWNENPFSPTLVTDMPPAMVADCKAIRTNGGDVVFRWGGDYTTNKDAMHWEVVASPAELAAGIAGFDLTPTPDPTRPNPEDVMTNEQFQALRDELRDINRRLGDFYKQSVDSPPERTPSVATSRHTDIITALNTVIAKLDQLIVKS
jgi:hypothetical protein